MKKLLAVLIAAIALLSIAGLAAAPEVSRWEYKGDGRFEIEFRRDADYENLTLTVTDPTGAEMTAVIRELDDDEITFRIENYQPETTYAYVLTGVREGFSGDFGTVEGTVTVPADGDYIKEVDCDLDDREVEIEFLGRVEYENVQVTIYDELGVACETSVKELDDDSIELRVSDLTRGQEYTVEITGIRRAGDETFGTVSKVFTAR